MPLNMENEDGNINSTELKKKPTKKTKEMLDENTKQIAVRKVFGSDVARETWRTVRNYMILVGVACIIGIPLAIWAARLYLQRFAYRIEGYGWVFIVAVIISLAIAFGSVLWQTLRAARTNPATELKKE